MLPVRQDAHKHETLVNHGLPVMSIPVPMALWSVPCLSRGQCQLKSKVLAYCRCAGDVELLVRYQVGLAYGKDQESRKPWDCTYRATAYQRL